MLGINAFIGHLMTWGSFTKFIITNIWSIIRQTFIKFLSRNDCYVRFHVPDEIVRNYLSFFLCTTREWLRYRNPCTLFLIEPYKKDRLDYVRTLRKYSQTYFCGIYTTITRRKNQVISRVYITGYKRRYWCFSQTYKKDFEGFSVTQPSETFYGTKRLETMSERFT